MIPFKVQIMLIDLYFVIDKIILSWVLSFNEPLNITETSEQLLLIFTVSADT